MVPRRNCNGKLLALRLQGTPPEDAIVGTAEVWLRALWPDRTWAEHIDRIRIQQAFRVLFRICDRWPTPKLFLDNLGSRPQPQALPPPGFAEVIARNKAKLKELMEQLANSLNSTRRISTWQPRRKQRQRRMRARPRNKRRRQSAHSATRSAG